MGVLLELYQCHQLVLLYYDWYQDVWAVLAVQLYKDDKPLEPAQPYEPQCLFEELDLLSVPKEWLSII